MPRGVSWVLAVLVAAAFAAFGLPLDRAIAATQPNIVLVVTDDQRWDTLWAMPTVTQELVDKGVTFSNAFASNPLCCPSRTTILTGRYSHGTGIYTNPAFRLFDDSSTIATWLQNAGYRTALVGKYLTGYPGDYHPPGWREWVAFSARPNYFDYKLYRWSENVPGNGTIQPYGTLGSDYSTDVLAAEAASFIRSTPSATPLFLMYTPLAPHGRRGDRLEAIPAPRDVGTFAALEPWRPPSYDEADVSDKTPWVRRLRRFPVERIARGDLFRQAQLESLQAVDDAVGRMLDALEDTGRLANTMVVFISDNGHAWGEHRWLSKVVPYEESIRVPLVVRYDPVTSVARADRHLVANVDLAPTFAELAGVRAPRAQGRSLLPLLDGSGNGWRQQLLLENVYPPSLFGHMPAYCGLRTHRYTYVQYRRRGREELYDLTNDRYQLDNLSAEPSRRWAIARFRTRVRRACNPPPPGLTPRSPCLVSGGPRGNELRGTRFYDLICGHRGNDRIFARAGNDDVVAGSGDDVVYGLDGSDVLQGNASRDRLAGGLGLDRLKGGAGRDTLTAVDGLRDVVDCGPGADRAVLDRIDRARACESVVRRAG